MLENPNQIKDEIIDWIKKYFEKNGKNTTAVVGISGGKDSLVVAKLCVEALGKDKVFGVLMPNGVQADLDDSLEIVSLLQIKHTVINIKKSYDALFDEITNSFQKLSAQTTVNLAPRLRMATLYAVAQSLPNGGRVANTCNRSEDFVGYSTKFGDSAGDFSPLHDLLVSEVRQVGYALNLPERLVDKTPSDGLCGKSDEDNLGFSYAQLEQYILNKTTGDKKLDETILKQHTINLHKLETMPYYNRKEYQNEN